MNREIKFRVWDASNKKMIYQDLLLDIADGYELARPSVKHKDLNPLNVTLQQYTGLKDKNDKEIYEGDICRLNYYKSGVIKYSESMCGFYWHAADACEMLGAWESKFIEITGNVFEHPELISDT